MRTAYSTHGEDEKYILLDVVIQIKCKIPLWTPRHGWKGDIKIGLKLWTGFRCQSMARWLF